MSNLIYCVGGKHYSNTIDITKTEKINPKTNKRIIIIRGKCVICNRNKSKILTK